MRRFEFKYSLAYLLAVLLLQGCVIAVHVDGDDEPAPVEEATPDMIVAIDSGIAA